jgi:hypothetical protein
MLNPGAITYHPAAVFHHFINSINPASPEFLKYWDISTIDSGQYTGIVDTISNVAFPDGRNLRTDPETTSPIYESDSIFKQGESAANASGGGRFIEIQDSPATDTSAFQGNRFIENNPSANGLDSIASNTSINNYSNFGVHSPFEGGTSNPEVFAIGFEMVIQTCFIIIALVIMSKLLFSLLRKVENNKKLNSSYRNFYLDILLVILLIIVVFLGIFTVVYVTTLIHFALTFASVN